MSGVTVKSDLSSADEPPQPERKSSEGRKYAVIQPESIKIIAEASGISGLNQDIATLISQDVSYRLNEIIHNCSIFLRQSKRRILLATDVDEVFKDTNIPLVYGHLPSIPAPYAYVKEADVFVPEDNIVDLCELAFCPEFLAQKEDPFIKESWLRPGVEEVIKLEPPDPDSPPSTAENIASNLSIPSQLLSYYTRISSVILGTNQKHLQVVVTDLKTNNKIGRVIPFILNSLVLGIQKLPRRRWRFLLVAKTLLMNPSIQINVTSSVQHLIKALLICALESRAPEGIPAHEEYRIKSEAALIMGMVVRRWCVNETKLRFDIIQKLGSVLYNGSSSLRSHYGALASLVALGNEALDFCLWPHLAQYLSFLESKTLQLEVKEIEGAMLDAAEVVFRRELSNISEPSTSPQGITALDRMLTSYFGDALCARSPAHAIPTFEDRSRAKREDKAVHDLDADHQEWPKIPRRSLSSMFGNNKNVSVLKKSNTRGERNLCDLFDLPDAKRRQIDDIQMNFAGGKPVSKEQLLRRTADPPSPSKTPSVYYRKSCQVGYIGKATGSIVRKKRSVISNYGDILLSSVL